MISKLESGRRWSADKLFRERIERELRHGGRMALIANVAIRELPTGAATVVAVHLEDKRAPSCRRRQVEALLSEVKNDTHPVKRIALLQQMDSILKATADNSILVEFFHDVLDEHFR